MVKIVWKRVIIIMLTCFFVSGSMVGLSPSLKAQLSAESGMQTVQDNLLSHVHTLAHEIGVRDFEHYENLSHAAEYIAGNFRELGYRVEEMPYEADGRIFKNIVAEIPGADMETPDIVIVGAHYDSCDNPGADDNASGIAGLIEIARLMKEETTGARVRFVAFVNEEPPFYDTDKMGSRVYVKSIAQDQNNIRAAIILEMIGYYTEKPNSQRYPPFIGFFYPNQGNFIAVVSNFPSWKLKRRIVASFKKETDFPIESLVSPSFVSGISYSDHSSFWKSGIPAVMITDTAYLRNPHYHGPTDRPDTLDYKKMSRVITGIKSAILDLSHEQ